MRENKVSRRRDVVYLVGFWFIWNAIYFGMVAFNNSWTNGFSPYSCRATGGVKWICDLIPNGFKFNEPNTFLLVGNFLVLILLLFLASSRGWFKTLFNFLESIFSKSPSEINLAWEVRRIRRLLEFFYLLTWLGLVLALFNWFGS